MLMKRIFAAVFFFVCSYQASHAQAYSFKVLVNKGKNEVKSSGGWQQLKVGASLNEKDELRVGPNAYIGLVHVTGKPIELKEAKTYKVADLSRQISAGSSVVTKYTDFILSTNSSNANRLGATGAVDRSPKPVLMLHLPVRSEQGVFFNPTQTFTWDAHGLKGPFEVTFHSLFEDELKTIKTSENSVTIDLDGREFDNEDNILVQVISRADNVESKRITLKRLSKPDRAHVDKLLKDMSFAAAESTALSNYILAGFYEEKKLLIDAATYYAEAIKLEPEVDLYKDNFEAFLIRNGIKSAPASDK